MIAVICGLLLLFPCFGMAEMAILSETELQTTTGAEGICWTAVKGDCPSYQKDEASVLSDEDVLKLIEDGSLNLTKIEDYYFLSPDSPLNIRPAITEVNLQEFDFIEIGPPEISLEPVSAFPSFSLPEPEATYIYSDPPAMPVQPQVDTLPSWQGTTSVVYGN
ncbi:MAG: hypothetical protein SWH61_01665 [Thermodesulfobacteriota bacterium]|nr:hypothetical protein [Thermodesulfobacteriota bacterium]